MLRQNIRQRGSAKLKLRSWWQQNKGLFAIFAIITLFAGTLVLLIFTGYRYIWTGFSNKTFWDWLQLFLLPVVIVIGGIWLNHMQRDRAERTAEQQAKSERKTAEQQAQNAREIAFDKQREAILQAYIDTLSHLLLEKKLRFSENDDEVRIVASAQTLTVLARLDVKRKKSVLQFLHQSNLIDKNKCIIDLRGADLKGADLSGANLDNANLRGTHLYKANLRLANLRDTDLRGTDLRSADLSGASLRGADLCGAFLDGTDLSEANLSGTDLRGTNLRRTDLRGAFLGSADLRNASLTGADLRGANMRDALTEDLKLV